MSKEQLIVKGGGKMGNSKQFSFWLIVILLLIIAIQLGVIISKLGYIDWDIRNILGKLTLKWG